MLEPDILTDPEILNGTPCFRGTRVPFKNLIDYIEGGDTLMEFLQQLHMKNGELLLSAELAGYEVLPVD